MEPGKAVWILSGRFGRATVNLNDRALVEHAHRQINILLKLGGADAHFLVDGKELALNDASMLLFNSWLPHGKLAGPPCLILSLFIEPDWLGDALPHTEARVTELFADAQVTLTEEVHIQASRLATAITAQHRASQEQCERLLLDLVDAIVAQYAGDAAERSLMPRRQMIDFRIRKALAYMQANSLRSLQMEELARQVGLSRSRFFEQFRRCVGTSPQQYADYIRVTTATRLLSTTDLSLAELADELGFAGHSNFTRFFTQHIGVPPSEFRRQTSDAEMMAVH
ncbi:helix-turn-helix domain-containing protein [Niveispirillum sp. KHB5.9]|uniref:helix-turn-helix domain-containing protein n=1 Tax=Niveispirillum sp. KHB5.9 TaxID=3400269 RepID=UPI003A8467D4